MFAKGELDAGTQLLLGALTDFPETGTVLDFGCGSGVIGAVLQRRQPGLQLQCLDADAVAVHAAQRNVSGALVRCGASWSALPAYKRYDAIVSNPPIHMGKHRDYRVLVTLIEEGGLRLAEGGSLWMVVQRQVPVERNLQDWWASVELVAEDTRFRVWRAQQPFD
jgi:16S rRNA (guanine1207-N2)-methyltransferase